MSMCVCLAMGVGGVPSVRWCRWQVCVCMFVCVCVHVRACMYFVGCYSHSRYSAGVYFAGDICRRPCWYILAEAISGILGLYFVGVFFFSQEVLGDLLTDKLCTFASVLGDLLTDQPCTCASVLGDLLTAQLCMSASVLGDQLTDQLCTCASVQVHKQ